VVERDDRPPVATFFVDGALALAPGAVATLAEAAAHHARVKRLEAGDGVRLVDGMGHIGVGTIEALDRTSVEVRVTRTAIVPPPSPIHLRVPISDRDRMLWLAEKATELGITTWQSVRFRRSSSVSPRGEGPAFAEKLRARMLSALEQSAGAWLPAFLGEAPTDRIEREAHHLAILLDVDGPPLASLPGLSTAASPVILFGPEGGLETEERDALIGHGWLPATLAPATLRFETAGLAAVAVCRNLAMLRRTD
jgi:16S rRNA (uracil1498-N3)-methyltransferase